MFHFLVIALMIGLFCNAFHYISLGHYARKGICATQRIRLERSDFDPHQLEFRRNSICATAAYSNKIRFVSELFRQVKISRGNMNDVLMCQSKLRVVQRLDPGLHSV